MLESLGVKLRKQRRKLGLTLDDLAERTGISKPYLSLIETGRVPNPPSDEKLRKLETTLSFAPGELLSQAHLMRTPLDVRAALEKLIRASHGAPATDPPATPGVNLDAAYLSGVLQDLVEKSAGNIEHVRTNAVPVINKVSAGYPKDFTDLSYPRGVADDYVACPEVHDSDAFAARVHGDSMMPKYREGDIVIFSPAATPKSGDDCFVRFADGHTTFKRVFFEADDAGTRAIRLQPRNERYRPQTATEEALTGVYKAVFKYQKVDGD
ncbi:MAG: helix-turn-helix domain-containing protein [Tepidisphaerales bacterium]